MSRYRGPTYYGHPYLDGRGVFLDGHPLEHNKESGDADLARHDPPRVKRTHPYAYDPFTIWGDPFPSKQCNGTVYTDRLHQEDPDKYARLALKHYQSGGSDCDFARGLGVRGASPNALRPFDSYNCKGELIEAFLRDWFDDQQMKLLRVVEYCDPHSGYETWRCDYVTGTAKESTAP